jgi:hypothetical protein
MPTAIEFQREFTEKVYINLPGPKEFEQGMTGTDLLHGFLAGLYTESNPQKINYIISLCLQWNVHYVEAQVKIQ